MRKVIARALLFASLLAPLGPSAGCRKPAPAPETPAAAPERVASAATVNEPSVQDRPATKDACAACNGKWGRHGLADKQSCLCRTKDSGRPCLDGAECQGQCVAEEKDFVVVEKGPPPRGHFKGKCSEFDLTFGCHRFVPRGARTRGPLALDDAAEQLCYD